MLILPLERHAVQPYGLGAMHDSMHGFPRQRAPTLSSILVCGRSEALPVLLMNTVLIRSQRDECPEQPVVDSGWSGLSCVYGLGVERGRDLVIELDLFVVVAVAVIRSVQSRHLKHDSCVIAYGGVCHAPSDSRRGSSHRG